MKILILGCKEFGEPTLINEILDDLPLNSVVHVRGARWIVRYVTRQAPPHLEVVRRTDVSIEDCQVSAYDCVEVLWDEEDTAAGRLQEIADAAGIPIRIHNPREFWD